MLPKAIYRIFGKWGTGIEGNGGYPTLNQGSRPIQIFVCSLAHYWIITELWKGLKRILQRIEVLSKCKHDFIWIWYIGEAMVMGHPFMRHHPLALFSVCSLSIKANSSWLRFYGKGFQLQKTTSPQGWSINSCMITEQNNLEIYMQILVLVSYDHQLWENQVLSSVTKSILSWGWST